MTLQTMKTKRGCLGVFGALALFCAVPSIIYAEISDDEEVESQVGDEDQDETSLEDLACSEKETKKKKRNKKAFHETVKSKQTEKEPFSPAKIAKELSKNKACDKDSVETFDKEDKTKGELKEICQNLPVQTSEVPVDPKKLKEISKQQPVAVLNDRKVEDLPLGPGTPREEGIQGRVTSQHSPDDDLGMPRKPAE